MAAPLIAAGLVGASLSLAAGISGNRSITKQANENWNNQLEILGLKRSIDFTNILDQTQEVQNEVGLALTNLGRESNKAKATTVASTAERNAYGATAAKMAAQVDMDASLITDSIVQSGDAAMKDLQMSLSSANYDYNSGVYQASTQRASMLNQRKGGFELLAGAASTGISFASGYKTMTG